MVHYVVRDVVHDMVHYVVHDVVHCTMRYGSEGTRQDRCRSFQEAVQLSSGRGADL